MNDSELLKHSITFLQSGYFKGAQLLAKEIIDRGTNDQKKRAARILWLSSIYTGDSEEMIELKSTYQSVLDWVKGLGRGQGVAEAAVLLTALNNFSGANELATNLIAMAQRQSGPLVTHHPSAILMLAEICQNQLDRRDDSIRLVNLALGFRGVYAGLADVRRLAFLLNGLQAPISLWADLAAIFARHITFASTRRIFWERELTWHQEAIEWAANEDNNSLIVLRHIVQIAPSHFKDLFAEAFSLYSEGSDMAEVLQEQGIVECGLKNWEPTNPMWWSLECMTYRYPWMNLLAEEEQKIMQNGDWALFMGPNPDFSMGTAQWWRCVESVLKRVLIKPLARRFSENPHWVRSDQQNLTERAKKDESCFFDVADARKMGKMTLQPMLMVLEKSLAGLGDSGSLLRREACSHVDQYRRHFEPLVRSFPFNPAPLTRKAIENYRNSAAHDQTLPLVKASMGRAQAKILLDQLHSPVLLQQGFAPTLCE
jgi:hypothetical protein